MSRHDPDPHPEPRRDWPPASSDKRPEPWPSPPSNMDWASI